MKQNLFITTLAIATALSAPCLNRAFAADTNNPQAKLQAQTKISEAKAREIALTKAPGGTVQASELEEENGHLIWSFDISSPGTRNIAEVQVDAKDGTIVSATIETPKDQTNEAAADKKAATSSAKNDALRAAAEPFEGVTEAALDGVDAKTAEAIKAAEASRSATRALLTPAATARFDQLFDELTGAQAKKDGVAVAVQAAEIYKLLVSSVEASTLTVPMEVSLLDYAGFRTNALLKAAVPDWQALAATAHEANSNWAKIRGRVTDQKLQAAMDRAQAGLASAAQKHDAGLGQSSAKDDLNLVDELEAHFARK